MISARLDVRFDAFAVRLAQKARAVAEARAESVKLARKGSPSRWRRAALLWPLFTKG